MKSAATCRGCGGPTTDALVYCDDCYRKGGRTDSAAATRCLCAERGLLGIHETECAGFGSRSDELCEQAEREARAAGEWPPESPAAMTYRCATCGKPVTVAHYGEWPSECPHCKTAPPTLILKVPS